MKPRCNKSAVFLAAMVTILMMSLPAIAQQLQSEYWHFGEHCAIKFNGPSGPVTPVTNSALNTAEGCATQCDPVTGQLLFYTDGQTVYNKLNTQMQNGYDLNGDYSTAQSAMIVPVMGNPNRYFIFNPAATTANDMRGRCYCLYYSVVDISRNNGMGEVIIKNELVWSDITEHLTATINCQGNGYWIVVRSAKSQSRLFYAFAVKDEKVILEPVVSDAGHPTIVLGSVGQMHISPNAKKLVITSYKGHTLLYDFDAATGKVTNGINLFDSESNGSHYGAAFSLDGTKVYSAVSGASGSGVQCNIFQFQTDQRTAQEVKATKKIVGVMPGTPEWTPMQLALNGKIYVGRPRTNILGVIDHPEQAGLACAFKDSALTVPGTIRYGLPNILGSSIGEPYVPSTACEAPLANFNIPKGCEGTCIAFKNTSTGRIDNYLWTFQGAEVTTSTARDPLSICYKTPGIYQVTLTVTNSLGSNSITKSIAIYPRPRIVIDDIEEACPGETVRLRVSGAKDYVWSPAEGISDPRSSAPSVVAYTTTTYKVIGTNLEGCADTALVVVRVKDVKASPDVTVCKGAKVQLSATGATTYTWSPAIYLDDPFSARPICHPDESTTYIVRMTSGKCTIYDTVVVTVADTFSVVVSGPTEICPGQSVIPSVVGGTEFLWSPTEGVSDPTSPNPTITPARTTTYKISARSGSCFDTTTYTIIVSDVPQVKAPRSETVCSGDSVTLVSTATIPPSWNGTYQIVWSSNLSTSVDTGVVLRTQVFQSTTYKLKLITLEGCVTYDSVRVTVSPTPTMNAGEDLATCDGAPVRAFVTGTALQYSWYPTIGVSNPNSSSPSLTPPVTTTYIVTGRTGTCVVYDTITVFVKPQPLRLSDNQAICRGMSVQLNASGAAFYSWSPTYGLNDPTIPNPIATPTLTTDYEVLAIDAFGCSSKGTIRITVYDNIPLKVTAGVVNAPAGHIDTRIPIYIEVDEKLLPLHIDRLVAVAKMDATAFMPTTMAWGSLDASSVKGTDRIIRMDFKHINVLQAKQKFTELRGIALVGLTQSASIVWDSVAWEGVQCPQTQTEEGKLYIFGCNLRSRLIKQFASTRVEVVPDEKMESVLVNLTGSTPGDHTIRVWSSDGVVVYENTYQPFAPLGSEATLEETTSNVPVDMGNMSSGVYFVTISSSYFSHTVPIQWIR